MLQKKMLFIVLVSALLMCASGQAAPVNHGSPELSSAVFSGKTRFEKRHTFVPMEICGTEPCVASQPYWALVIQSEKGVYEYDQPYAMGSEQAPESIDVGKVTVRPGSRVRIDGVVETLSQDFALITEILQINLEMDARGRHVESSVPEYYGWQCHSATLRPETVYTHVWSTHDGYHLRIVESVVTGPGRDDRAFHEIADIDGATSRRQERTLIYEGRGRGVEIAAALEIRDVSGQFDSLPARLKLTRIYASGTGVRVPIESEDEQICSPNRLHPLTE